MTPQQKHAVLVMLDSIQAQVNAVRALVGAADISETTAPAPHRTTAPATDSEFLTEDEEKELEDELFIRQEDSDKMLQELLAKQQASQTAEKLEQTRPGPRATYLGEVD